MRDFFSRAKFVIPMWPGVALLVVTSIFVVTMTVASRDSTVRTAAATCTVGEAYTTRDGINFRLRCQEAAQVTSTTTGNPEIVLAVMRERHEHITCDVMQSGWTSNCRVGS